MEDKKIAFGWYGGKYSHLNWLLPLLPQEKHYCEPFGGSAAVLLNRAPAELETYNDLDDEVVNFFKVLREQKDKLIEKIKYTPYSRKEFVKAINNFGGSDLERARRFYVLARQSRMALIHSATPGRWKYCITDSRRNRSGAVSQYQNSIQKLEKVAERLSRVQIENRPAIDVIKRYDSSNTLFYCDPPYVHESRTHHEDIYAHEMSNEDHKVLAELLKQIDGKVAVSGYESELYNELYSDWNKIKGPERVSQNGSNVNQEIIWTNYDTSKIGQQNLFKKEVLEKCSIK